MKILKNLGLFTILIFGLQAMTLQGAQESKMPEENSIEQDRQKLIKDAIKTRPNLVEGFNVLITEGLHDQSYQGFVNSELSYDEDDGVFNFEKTISDATDLVVEKIKKPFLVALNNAIQNNIEITKIYDPVFLYVMKYKDGFMQLPIGRWVNEKDNDGRTPLHNAAINNNKEVAKLLIDADANLDIKDDYFGDAPLHLAARYNKIEITKLLIAAGANLNIQNSEGYTPLYQATKSNNIEVVKLLIDAGANVNIKDNSGYTPLYEVTMNFRKTDIDDNDDNVEIVKLLIAAGADVNIQNRRGAAPLYFAAIYNKIKIVKLLIDAGANVNIKDNSGATPLHLAVYAGAINIVKLLIAAGADLNIKDRLGYTPLHEVNDDRKEYMDNDVEIAKLLIAAGANLNIKDNSGRTAEQKARTPEMRAVFEQARKQKEANEMRIFENQIKKDWR